jgi:hypothetical protein
MMVRELEPTINSLIQRDTDDETDRAWLVATYLSFQAAEELGFRDYEFDTLSLPDQTPALIELLGQPLLETRGISTQVQQWKAGYFFNNAVLRLVAFAEVRLKVLYGKSTKCELPHNYWTLVQWYEAVYSDNLTFLGKARKQVNLMKHQRHEPAMHNMLKSLDDGLTAFSELLRVSSRVVEV